MMIQITQMASCPKSTMNVHFPELVLAQTFINPTDYTCSKQIVVVSLLLQNYPPVNIG